MMMVLNIGMGLASEAGLRVCKWILDPYGMNALLICLGSVSANRFLYLR